MKQLPECVHCGAWLVQPRTTICDVCEANINNYANAKIKSDKALGYPYHPSMDQDVTGAPLHGRGSREAQHRQHMVKQKEEE